MPKATRKTATKAARRADTHQLLLEEEANKSEIDSAIAEKFITDFKIKSMFRNCKPKHREFFRTILNEDTHAVFVAGPAGTAKTYFAVRAALTLLKEKKIDNIVYIRSVIESASRSLGALPGEVDDKFAPYAAPLVEKVTEITGSNIAHVLVRAGRMDAIPVNFARGMTFRDSVVIIDEAQNMTRAELVTLLTRFGFGSKYVICGDMKQADIRDSGFADVFGRFNNLESADNGIHTFEFDEKEIVRSKILKYIVSALEA